MTKLLNALVLKKLASTEFFRKICHDIVYKLGNVRSTMRDFGGRAEKLFEIFAKIGHHGPENCCFLKRIL